MIWRSTIHKRIAQFIDFITVLISFAIAYLISILLFNLAPKIFPPIPRITELLLLIILTLAIIYVILFSYQKAYSYQRFTSILREYKIVLKVCIIGSFLGITLLFLFGLKEIPRTLFIIFFVVSFLLIIFEKSFIFYAASVIRKKGGNRKKVIVIGTEIRASNFIKIVNKNFHWGLDIVGALTEDYSKVGNEVEGIKVIDHYSNIEHILKKSNPDEIIITLSTKCFDQIRFILEACRNDGVPVRLNSDFFGQITKNITIDNVFGLTIISFNMVQHPEIQYFFKRLIDIVGSLIALTFFLPFMIVAAAGILFSDGFPIFYSFIGYGLNKKPIKVIKFRTMVKNSEEIKQNLLVDNEMEGPVFKIKNDPRIIPFGKWLRKFSIDETPQLFSVFKGDMSLVGPRQAMKEELEKYENWQRRRLSVKPGLTCLWQVNGRNEINSFNEWVKLDLQYIDNWSIWVDIKILLKTIPVVLLGKGI